MLIEKVDELVAVLGASKQDGVPPFARVLMAAPDFFTVEYAINPYMKNESGELHQIDVARARAQWEALRATYERLGLGVSVVPARPGLPDLVFSANQSFPFWDAKAGRKSVLLSRMRSEFRRPEVPYFREWYAENGYEIWELDRARSFEGNGDALLHPGHALVWGGHGPRTTIEAYDEIARRFDLAVVPLRLVAEEFYHLDTCFSILDARTVAYLPDAFSPESRALIEAGFERRIVLDRDENLRGFAGNCHCPNGEDVILHRGSPKLLAALREAGFRPHEVDTSEFMKSGGSVFCLKMMVF